MATDENAVSESTDQATSDTQAAAENKLTSGLTSEAKSGMEKTAVAQESKDVKEELMKLQEQLKQAENKAAKHWDELLRAKADLENTRKRLQREVENAHKYAVEKFVQDLLPVIDSLERGISAAKEMDTDIKTLKEGAELTFKMFNDCASRFGVEPVYPQGEPFNPQYHQAVSIQETSDYAPDTVIAVMQKGYLLNGRLVRPAMVVVSKTAEQVTDATGHETQKSHAEEVKTDTKA
ncbi:MAG: nucleotide exchange factor GrpE [Gammaproteobacteria bacterium]|nr:nucleotide exchange factor GrpE [Gammaproteobacteria bacterium]